PHRRHEVTGLGFLEGISRLSVNVRLHMARSWLDVTTEGSRVLHRRIGPTIRTVGLRLPSSDTHITPTSAIRSRCGFDENRAAPGEVGGPGGGRTGASAGCPAGHLAGALVRPSPVAPA